jgi:hypothetical protein
MGIICNASNAPCSKILFHDVEIRLRLIEGQYGEGIFRKGQCRAPRCGVRPEFRSEQGRVEGELDREHEGETSGGCLSDAHELRGAFIRVDRNGDQIVYGGGPFQ